VVKVDDLEGLPGAELVIEGLDDLGNGRITECSLLLLVAAPRLRALGIDIPVCPEIERPVEHRLYEHLEHTHGEGAHSRYNSLIRRIVSFSSVLEHEASRNR
jgi:hypothetical protein